MPLALIGRTKDAVAMVSAAGPWQDGVARFLGGIGAGDSLVERHVALLEDRAAGRLPSRDLLADATLPNGRPMPPSRRYAEMLVDEDRLPLYDVEGVRFSIDLHNPGNEASVAGWDPAWLELAVVADVRYFSALMPGSVFAAGLPFEEQAHLRATAGATLGTLLAALVEATDAEFGYADIGATGWIVPAASDPARVVHPAPPALRPWDFLWSITAWSTRLLDEGLRGRLGALEVTPAMLERIDRWNREWYRVDRRTLATRALWIQYRYLFGSESRGERASIDTPLAKQAKLRSTNLLYRT